MKLHSITITPAPDGRYLIDWVRLKRDGTRHIASMFVRGYWRNWFTWLIPLGWEYEHLGISSVFYPCYQDTNDLPDEAYDFDIDAGYVDYERRG